jgi:hypothetical protein
VGQYLRPHLVDLGLNRLRRIRNVRPKQPDQQRIRRTAIRMVDLAKQSLRHTAMSTRCKRNGGEGCLATEEIQQERLHVVSAAVRHLIA